MQSSTSSARRVSETAMPFHGGTGRVGVLFCHGFTGSPWSLLEWAKATADAGYRVALPRLPGHGTSWQEMNLTGWQDWYSCIEREFDELRSQCDQVFVAGLSMGGSLALLLAEKRGDQVAGLMLVNPAVLPYPKDQFAPIAQHFISSVKAVGSDIADPGVTEHAYPRSPVRAAASMMKMWVEVRACLDLVACPLLLFRSAVDHVVPDASKDFIRDHVSSDVIIERVLERSYHVATMDYDRQQIFTESLDFLAVHSQADRAN
ncbi:alpha/beta fold hydrolase [Propionicimonas sp.]|uniref:alpha/beta hydrolase n=1 Tax=Propionicimonas sp. TaxID=1955623 RepID=UPI001795862A|nr:alpha/beta fold hydrolase [Propionicimonas sp.]MBU3976513.1 alpha/beta fold hydrolase [Actinomycetota bacterium]MBA3020487.1 alpha/beta fold hydrolase [Propionicimonas sp.]MBU3986660.1 alpha/beta fold hydrolase [Actinomycetota bacterium]MBU4007188.1 alpha/beta fold hydrolase [Actinomycetota bacterium]MBU4064941.1 alpha/beta fold hydrolase [Actinomycetota bacterium]